MPSINIGPVIVDGRLVGRSNDARLPALNRNVHFSFQAQTLPHPEGMPYRIRLAPLDDAWQDVGERNEITYANLGPGRRST